MTDLSLSTALSVQLEHAFAANGPLAATLEGFVPRASQTEMASAVATAIERRDTLIVEAGTGTGKTFAYLTPALLAGGKVIVSTGTKTLQDQLFQRDLPLLRNALTVPVTVALLKGRANYVCHYHLERTLQNGRLSSRQDVGYLHEINRFVKVTTSGDRAELASVPEQALVWQLVTSTRDNCLGSDCSHYQDCFVMQARRAAQQADVVVVNHHLFFADLMLKDTGVAELLPSANTVIFDEAHQLPEIATVFFGQTLSTSQLFELCRDAVAEGLSHARDAVDWVKLVAPLERASRDLRLAFGAPTRLPAAQIEAGGAFWQGIDRVVAALTDVDAALQTQAERADALAQCHRRATALLLQLEGWIDAACGMAQRQPATGDAELAADDAQTVSWVEIFATTVQLHQTPLSIAPAFAKQRGAGARAWIFTSATLSVKGDFSHYAAQMGLDRTKSLTLPSPFDYGRQGLLYVPTQLPQPSAPQFTDAVVAAALPVIEAAGGKTFVLCTTLRAVDRAAALLRDAFAAHGWDYPLLIQGDAGKTELLDRFRALGNAVLVGSQSFWEGVDVRGDALSVVVIDKLPFAPPDDPVLAARLDALQKKGLSPFAVHQLPHAVITLKQGAGRLIRSESDRGVLMICDPRLVDKPYGRRIWQSLPPFKRSRELQTVVGFLQQQDQHDGAPG